MVRVGVMGAGGGIAEAVLRALQLSRLPVQTSLLDVPPNTVVAGVPARELRKV